LPFLNTVQKTFNFFLFTSLFIALCAVAMAFQTAYLFRLPHQFVFYGFVFCGTMCSYNTHWGFTPKHFQNPISRNGLAQIPIALHIVLAIAAFIGAIVFFLLMWPHWFWLAGAGLLSALYTAPKLPLPFAPLMQKVAFGKTIFLTLAWTYITATLPLLLTNTPIETPQILFVVNRFYLIYSICIIFDLRDRENDRKEGIKSIITSESLPAIDRIYWGSLLVYFATALALGLYFPITVVLAFLVPGLILAFGYTWFKKQQADYVYNFILDGLMVFSLPLLLLFGI
jgi:hypothetical protein